MPAMTPRAIVEEVLSPAITKELWSGNYEKVLPISVQNFDITAILPAVFYMFRFGHRRGRGRFIETFGVESDGGKKSRKTITIEGISKRLSENIAFEGFEGELGQAILGDLLLCFCLENTKHEMGRDKQVQRVAPAHYMASWIDLPERIGDLRYVPEMVVAMLADQKGEFVEQNKDGDKTWFAVGRGFENNVLIQAFRAGMKIEGEHIGSLKSDCFEEKSEVGLDQLLMIRLAQELGQAPEKSSGKEQKISNQRPIAEKIGNNFSEDIRRFVRYYSELIPRHAFVEILESCIAVGLTTIIDSVTEILFSWSEEGPEGGRVPKKEEQKPTFFLVDCSNGMDTHLRSLSEQSMDDYMRRLEFIPVIMMALRILDREARYNREIKKLNIDLRPYATEWLNLLGGLINGNSEESRFIFQSLEIKIEELAEKIQEEKIQADYPEAYNILKNDRSQTNPVWRLSEALVSLQGRKVLSQLIMMFDSSLLVGAPNGLCKKRQTSRKDSFLGTAVRRQVRSFVLTDSVLDYLVHLHVLNVSGKAVTSLSFELFLEKIYSRYGFCVEIPPPGMNVSNELLQLNRAFLERRLRDLGLLTGVNDAESMKLLKPRFEQPKER